MASQHLFIRFFLGLNLLIKKFLQLDSINAERYFDLLQLTLILSSAVNYSIVRMGKITKFVSIAIAILVENFKISNYKINCIKVEYS
ncbi:hypothetical protein QTP88_004436 [Uroleucon formosanum]